ncbi:hypothetical protein DFA_10502 [Cavenderia fasciculata]|uniref:Uncharacterized protein n=1 Tax=Cavenderia fasciculata TaxID=261658 RepID=F4QAE1_CACFS|nr:uncharacterized protein DFA_10502 [Cavenderia fasciculata]EGG15660.1 hypothetical protein DFA_10502 [Cavenderia fasciculata]|eukprot:XP_004354402.1 hypothetical protein DFA_10502 [Cavenderia fasciculata]
MNECTLSRESSSSSSSSSVTTKGILRIHRYIKEMVSSSQQHQQSIHYSPDVKEYAEKIGFNVEKYTTYVLSVKIEKQTNKHKKELDIIQDCFTQMKYNFTEIGSKQMFIQSILNTDFQNDQQAGSPSQELINQQETQISKGKKEFKEIKENNTKLINEIIKIINDIIDADSKLQKDKDNIIDLLIGSKSQINSLFGMNEKVSEMMSKELSLLSVNDKLISKIDWVSQYTRVLEKLNGCKVIQQGSSDNNNNNITCELTIGGIGGLSTIIYQVLLKFTNETNSNNNNNNNNGNLIGIQLKPQPCKELVEYLDELVQDYTQNNNSNNNNNNNNNDQQKQKQKEKEFGELLQEISFTLNNYHRRDREIEVATLKLQITRKDSMHTLLHTDFPSRHSCSVQMDIDYPLHPNSLVQLLSVHKNGQEIPISKLPNIQSSSNNLGQYLSYLSNQLNH